MEGDASRVALQHMTVLFVICGWFFDSQTMYRVITLVFTCQELSCCLPGIWCAVPKELFCAQGMKGGVVVLLQCVVVSAVNWKVFMYEP